MSTLTVQNQPSAAGRSAPVAHGARRLAAAGVALGCLFVLGMATLMSPSERGIGTHEQLNLPPCGWIVIADLPCMTCGMTTAFSHAVRGELLRSLLAQPFGFLLAMVTGMTLLVSSYVVVTGSNVAALVSRIWSARLIWIIVAIGLAAWGYKILAFKEIL